MKNSDIKKQTGLWASLIGEPTPAKTSGLTFSLATVGIIVTSFLWMTILIIVGATQQEGYAQTDWYLYVSYVLTPIVFALVAGGLLHWTKTPLKRAWEGQLCPPKYYLIAVLLQVGLFSLSQINNLFLEFLGNFGYQQAPIQIPSMEGFGFISVLFVIGVLPAIFEEILFRGIVLDGAYAYGTAGAALLCGGLFALFHQNPVQTIYQFCWGAAFALMAIRAGSVFPTMLAHFINNAVIIILQKCKVENIPTPVFIPVIIVSGLCLLGSLAYLIFVDKNRLPDEEGTPEQKKTKRGVFILGTAIGILICFASWASALYTGFVGTGA